MLGKSIRISLLIILLLFSLVQMNALAGPDYWWNDAWSFRQEIVLPIDTSINFTAYQPVDTTLLFESPCWAVNETQHSVRVICQGKEPAIELESQLYNLVHSDETHISSCNIVFLVPKEADGTERYYFYYDESETASPVYPDHVSIEDSSYFYEPIPGYPLESHFYKISQDGSIKYAVAQEGQFLWYSTSQYVTKLVNGATEMMPKNGEVIASFDFAYYYGYEMWQYNSTSQKLVSKDILCDGNLMVSCMIVSESTGGNLQTTAIYKYFYCPTSSERIQVHVTHEAKKDCFVYSASNTDGTYASLQCGGIKSTSIADLNFGELYPYIHVYSEQDTIEEYRIDTNPEYNQEDPVIRLIQTADDVDVGTKAWTSFDEGTTGTVHALVFGSSSVVKAGEGERDGLQLKAYESDYPHLPGLEYTVAAFQFTRNTYETNSSGKDMVIPKGFVAEFDAEFFSSPTGGYPLIEEETNIFQALAAMKPSPGSDLSPNKNETRDLYSLMVYVHGAPSLPLGSALSALTGHNFPYISVEVYRDETLVSSGTVSRLPLKPASFSAESSLRERFISAIHIFDIRNLSFFKKICFQQLTPGRYLIKVFKENGLLGNERRFIGYSVVELTKDAKTHVFCKPQGLCWVSLVDQQGMGINGAQVMLIHDDILVTQNSTDTKGYSLLAAPCSLLDKYQLRILYNGFEVENESIRLRYGRQIFPLKISLELDQYDWTLKLMDLWDLPLEINVIPRLISTTMKTPTVLLAEENNNDTYRFTNLVPSKYQLQIQYKSFLVEKEITIPSNDESLLFPAVFPVSLQVLDSRGMKIGGAAIQLSRGGKTLEVISNNSGAVLSLPPGLYLIQVISQGNVIGQRSLHVMSERSVDLITTQEPMFPFLVIILACVLVIIAFAVSVIKKDPLFFLFLVAVGFLMVALVFPWWSLQGSSSSVETSSDLFLVPLDLVTTTKTSQVIAGELAFFPDLFINVMTVIPVFTVIIGFLVFLSLVLKRGNKKRWQILSLVSAMLLLLFVLGLYIFAMSAFTDVGVGSFIGQGTLDVSIQAEGSGVSVSCQWGPGFGFWLYGLSALVLLSALLLIFIKNKKRKF
jgi:hypothetical protein